MRAVVLVGTLFLAVAAVGLSLAAACPHMAAMVGLPLLVKPRAAGAQDA